MILNVITNGYRPTFVRKTTHIELRESPVAGSRGTNQPIIVDSSCWQMAWMCNCALCMHDAESLD